MKEISESELLELQAKKAQEQANGFRAPAPVVVAEDPTPVQAEGPRYPRLNVPDYPPVGGRAASYSLGQQAQSQPQIPTVPVGALLKLLVMALSDKALMWANLSICGALFGMAVHQPSIERIVAAAAYAVLVHGTLIWRGVGLK